MLIAGIPWLFCGPNMPPVLGFCDLPILLGYLWGDVASVAGLVVALIGFSVTIWTVLKSKTAAQQAKDATDELRERIRGINTISDVAEAVATMEELKRLHRAEVWPIALDRYTVLKRLLIRIHAQHRGLSNERKAVLTGAITQFTRIEKKIERSVQDDTRMKIAGLNEIVTVQIDEITRLFAELQQEMGS